MTQGLTIRLAGVDFTGRRFRWEPGVYVKTFDGIDGGGETSFDSIPSGVGILDTDNKRQTPRTITITGFIYERTEWELEQRIAQLGALLGADDAVAEMTWQRTGEVRRASVRRLRFPPPTRRPMREPIADFTLTLRASDQRIYGPWMPPTAWGALVRVNNKGPFPAPVVIDVRGNANGYTITGPRGRVIQVTRSIAPGANHRHLGDEGVLLVGGVPQSDGVGRSDRIEVPYGPQEFTVDNGCELRVIFAPTWAP